MCTTEGRVLGWAIAVDQHSVLCRRQILLHVRRRQYVATGECDDKAGAYAIQGRAGRFVVELRGSYSGVMGLPLYETGQLLDKLPRR